MQIIDGTDRLSFDGAPMDVGPGVGCHNETHDYPQRVRSWREGDALRAETARADGTTARRWRYRRT